MTDTIKAVAEAIESEMTIDGGVSYMAAAKAAIEAMQSIENRPMVLELCGMNIEEISRMKYWWNANNPKPFNEFWEEAFGAGVYQANKAMQIREMTVEEAVEIIEGVIGYKFERSYKIIKTLAELGTIRIVEEV